MNRLIRKSCTLLLLLLGLSGLYPTFAQRANNPEGGRAFTSQDWGQTRQQEIRSLMEAHPPLFVTPLAPDHSRKDTIILFTFTDELLARGPGFSSSLRGKQDLRDLESKDVRISFAHEGWKTSYPFVYVRNKDTHGTEHKVWFLYYTMSLETQASLEHQGKDLEYRLIVDGVWMPDPSNPRQVQKINGAMVSSLSMEDSPHLPLKSPEISHETQKAKAWNTAASSKEMERLSLAGRNQSRTVKLHVLAKPGSEVYVQGTFNHFDPYMNRMEDIGPYWKDPEMRIYEAELRLLPGHYYYTYYIDGETQLDGLNKEEGSGPEGNIYSVFTLH